MGGRTHQKGPASAPNHTYDKCPPLREDLVARAKHIAHIARDRVRKVGAGARVGIVVLSLFDGIACVAQALQQLNIPVAAYEAAKAPMFATGNGEAYSYAKLRKIITGALTTMGASKQEKAEPFLETPNQ